MFGGPGDDTLNGGAGDDTLRGGVDTDTCDGSVGTDRSAVCEANPNVESPE
jgi:Ca2+-binding RTX toxin-like protein